MGSPTSPDSRPNGFVCTTTVDDLAATSAAIVEAGGQVALPPITIDGVGTVGYFIDTEGNVFGALQPQA